MNRLILPFLFVVCFLLIVSPVLATFFFSVPQNSINENQEIEAVVTLSLQNQGNKTYYLEGAFKREGGSNYFGQTWNDTDWVGYTATNNDKVLKSITTTPEGSWSGILKLRLDTTSPQLTGSGNYILKINRFTSTGSSPTSSDNEVILSVTINFTPTPIPTTPTPTPKPPTSTPKPPTNTPIPTPTDTPTPTLKTSKPTIKLSPTESITIPSSLLGVNTISPTIKASPSAILVKSETSPLNNFYPIAAGLIFILLGIFTFTFITKKKDNLL